MSNKSNYKGQAPPKYLNDFSKALANEVRILLQEVGQLRDERRALQYEIAELMAVKSKHGAGGEYSPDWKPKEMKEAQPEPPPPPPPPADDTPPAPAKPAWRTVNVRQEKKERVAKAKSLPLPAAAAAPAPPPPPELPAWAQWKPNPVYAPTPRPGTTAAPAPPPPPPRAQGLFGPRTPPPK